MKLIRAKPEVTKTTGEWTTIFNEDIRLAKNAKIGLYSCVLPLNQKNIAINDTNNDFTIRAGGVANTHNLTIPIGNYTSTELVNKMTELINGSLNANISREYGMKWLVDIDENGYVNLKYWTSPNNYWGGITKNMTITAAATNTYTANKDGNNTYTHFAYSRSPINTVCGGFRAQIMATTTQNTIVGLLNFIPTDSSTLSNDNFEYAIYLRDDSGTRRYSYNIGGAVNNTAYDVQTDDYIYILFTEGKIQLNVYRGTGGNLYQTLYEADFTETGLLYGAISLKTPESKIKQLKYTTDPQVNVSNQGLTQIYSIDPENNILDFGDDVESSLGAVPGSGRGNIYYTLNRNLSNLLGMPDNGQKNLKNSSWVALEKIVESSTPDQLLIELSNINLQSYDGFHLYKKRRNIIAYVPYLKNSLKGHRLVYAPYKPILLDLLNPEPMNIRQLQFRIIDNNDNLINLEPPSADLVLVVTDENEK